MGMKCWWLHFASEGEGPTPAVGSFHSRCTVSVLIAEFTRWCKWSRNHETCFCPGGIWTPVLEWQSSVQSTRLSHTPENTKDRCKRLKGVSRECSNNLLSRLRYTGFYIGVESYGTSWDAFSNTVVRWHSSAIHSPQQTSTFLPISIVYIGQLITTVFDIAVLSNFDHTTEQQLWMKDLPGWWLEPVLHTLQPSKWSLRTFCNPLKNRKAFLRFRVFLIGKKVEIFKLEIRSTWFSVLGIF